jgi:hypothetical protein
LEFLPVRRKGLILHVATAVLSAGGGGAMFWLALQQVSGPAFSLLLFTALVFLAPLPFVLYRGISLFLARYMLDRDGLRLRWGWRSEDIPLPDVEWVRPVSGLGFPLPLPRLHWPGSLLGTIQTPELGSVEYLASDDNENSLVLVATRQRIFVVSPQETNAFLREFQHAVEMGSISPIAARSTAPVVFFQDVWTDFLVRTLAVTGLLANVLLFLGVNVLATTRQSVSLGFDRFGNPTPPVPAERLLLLPVLSIIAYGIDMAVGLYLYRKGGNHLVTYLVVGSSILTAVLMVAAALAAV